MKIEKINENQIRCTLTSEDLAKRHLKLSELAYGSEKTQSLFREMIHQAGFEVGFEAENIPLMIEAIPVNADCIILLITKVDDPEELDTRFSRFSNSPLADLGMDDEEDDSDEEGGLSDITSARRAAKAGMPQKKKSFDEVLTAALDDKTSQNCVMFRFPSLSKVMDLAAHADWFTGSSALYKTNADGEYLLALSPAGDSAAHFKQLLSLASEYGCNPDMPLNESFLKEHCETLIAEDALFKLG